MLSRCVNKKRARAGKSNPGAHFFYRRQAVSKARKRHFVYWVRYFRSTQTVGNFYRSLLRIPAPGAMLPVAAFLLLGIYGRVIWLVISSVTLGIGHIGIQHIKRLGIGISNRQAVFLHVYKPPRHDFRHETPIKLTNQKQWKDHPSD